MLWELGNMFPGGSFFCRGRLTFFWVGRSDPCQNLALAAGQIFEDYSEDNSRVAAIAHNSFKPLIRMWSKWGVYNLPMEHHGSAAGCSFHLLKLACLSASSPMGDDGVLRPRASVGKEPWENPWTPDGNCSSGRLALVMGYVAPRSLGGNAVSSCCCRWPCRDHSCSAWLHYEKPVPWTEPTSLQSALCMEQLWSRLCSLYVGCRNSGFLGSDSGGRSLLFSCVKIHVGVWPCRFISVLCCKTVLVGVILFAVQCVVWSFPGSAIVYPECAQTGEWPALLQTLQWQFAPWNCETIVTALDSRFDHCRERIHVLFCHHLSSLVLSGLQDTVSCTWAHLLGFTHHASFFLSQPKGPQLESALSAGCVLTPNRRASQLYGKPSRWGFVLLT